MNEKQYDFSLADASSKPYAWMVDGVDKEDVREMGAEQYVEEYARTAINATNYSDGESDEDVYRRWREDTWEYDQAVAWIEQWLGED